MRENPRFRRLAPQALTPRPSPKGRGERINGRALERFQFICSVLGAMPTLAVGMFSRENRSHGHASVAMAPATLT